MIRSQSIVYPNDHAEILNRFLTAFVDDSDSIRDIEIGIRLEHVRQHLRVMRIGAFTMRDPESVHRNRQAIEAKVDRLL